MENSISGLGLDGGEIVELISFIKKQFKNKDIDSKIWLNDNECLVTKSLDMKAFSITSDALAVIREYELPSFWRDKIDMLFYNQAVKKYEVDLAWLNREGMRKINNDKQVINQIK